MSESATATTTQSKGEGFVSLADAMDAGLENANTQISQPEPSITPAPEPVKAQEKPVEINSKPANLDQIDLLTKRLTGQEDAVKEKPASEELDLKTPDNLKPEAQTAWARLTKDLRDARAKIKDLETKSSATDTTSTEQIDLQNQLQSLKQERDEYENELRFARLESTREYKTAVTEPLSVIQKEISDIASVYQTDPRSLYAAMVESDPAKRRAMLKEVTSSFDPVDSLALRQKAEDLQKVFERRDLLTRDVKTVLDMIESDERKEMEANQLRMKSEIDSAYKSEWDALQQENPLLRPIEDNENWNNTLKSIEQKALEIENTELDARSKARLTFHAAAMPVVMHVFQDYVTKTQAKIQELERAAKELRTAMPGAGSESGSAGDIPADLGFLDALERGMARR